MFDRDRSEQRARRTGRLSRAFAVFIAISLVASVALLLGVILTRDAHVPDERGAAGSTASATIGFFDVGQGLSVGVVTGDGASMLYDFGNSRADAEEIIIPFFREHDIDAIDYAVLSHPHQDHLGGLPAFLEVMPVNRFLDPVIETTNQTYFQSLEMIDERGIPASAARQGDTYALGDHATFEILWPTDELLTERDGEHRINDNSSVIRLDIGDLAVLLTGDIEEDAEAELIQTFDDGLDVDVLQVSHHGSDTSTSTDWLSHTTPETGIISSGLDNQYGHPHDEPLQRLREHEVQIYRTDIDGTVILRTRGDSYDITTERTDTS